MHVEKNNAIAFAKIFSIVSVPYEKLASGA